MPAGNFDIEIEQGSTLELDVTYEDTAGSVVDLASGYTAAMQVREAFDSASTILNLTSGSGITLTNVSPNIKIVVGPATTAALDFDHAFFDLELVVGATTTKILRGAVSLIREITK